MGLTLRTLQGAIGETGVDAFPTVGSTDRIVPFDWWVAVALRGAFLSPVVEEFFFRAVLLVSMFQLLRKPVGAVTASFASVLATSGAFLLIHAPFEPLGAVAALQMFAVGVACGLLVVLTGRIWAAVIAHIVYNSSFLFLMIVGTMLA